MTLASNMMIPYPDGGLNETMPPHMIGENQFSEMENYYYTRGGKFASRLGMDFIWSTDNYILALYSWRQVDGSVKIVFQDGNTFYGGYSTGPFTTITASATARTHRYFAPFEGVLYIGHSHDGNSTSADNLKWTGSGAGTTIPGSPPNLGPLCTWNFRMFGVDNDNPDTLYWSKVGDAEDWTATGISGAGFNKVGESGEPILALIAHNEQLIIIKAHSVYHIVTANPNTDTSAWRFELMTNGLGSFAHNALAAIGSDVIVPDRRGIFTLNTALYAGDFASVNVSKPIYYNSQTSHGAFNEALDQYMYFDYTDPSGSIYCMEKSGQNIRWSKIKIRSRVPSTGALSDTPLIPWRIAGGFMPYTTYGNFQGQYGVLISVLNVNETNGVSGYRNDILSYPTTRIGPIAHYDYIDGPDGTCPIKKLFKHKRLNFGSFGYEKRTRRVMFTCTKNDRVEDLPGDETTVSVIFDGDEANKETEKILTDVGTTVESVSSENFGIHDRTPIRTGIVGIGGANGRVYRSIELQVENNMGGYQLEYGAMELDVEKPDGKPTPSQGVLS